MGTALMLLQEKAARLSPQRQNELIDFAEFLLDKEGALAPGPVGEPAFDWVDEPGAEPLPYTSVELQHEAKESRLGGTLPVSELPKRRHKPTFDWVDDETAEPEPLTSVELQHLATQWMVEKLEKKILRSHETAIGRQHLA
jgi:hypothetical protein